MKTSSKSFRPLHRRALALLAGAFAVGLFSFGSSSCTCRQQVGVSALHSPGVAVEYDLPYDYLSAKYRQLYRTDPHWFHRHTEASYYNPYAGK